MKRNVVLPAEWHPQSAVQLTWPHASTDWAGMLDEVIPTFVAIAGEIMKREKLLIVCMDEKETRRQLGEYADEKRIVFRTIGSNDTWARDHGGIPVYEDGRPVVCDFVFNGWGMKFPASEDNLITRRLFDARTFAPGVVRRNMQPFVLEGGSIDTDGRGTLLTTARCLMSVNRNEHMTKESLEAYLKETFGLRRILWLEHGCLAGDDTDAHVDTLARFCSEDTIVYVKCDDPSDEHFAELHEMEKDLTAFRRENGEPYRLLPLPLPGRITWEGERLPATYANFLVINGAVLAPFYGLPSDREAADVLSRAFPGREVRGVNCLPLIRQHGSLHCVTMQYPTGFM
ncbi:MAG: agmatine deiminase family protein [Tannerellaceae bacterium]|jgi:agmatine/peptidylarginine deiminase|nr:agmatine deiminase family protein [Tannerellaceae bacterium]